jgi:hypothetical protein
VREGPVPLEQVYRTNKPKNNVKYIPVT